MVRAYRHLTSLGSASVRRDEGQTLTEYAVLIAMISLGLVGALSLLRDEIADFLGSIASQL